MLTKLRYAGVSTEDLLDIYVKFIRGITEYCSVVFHSRLTVAQTQDLERIQKTCLKIILAENYVSYEAALEMCALDTLHDRREQRCLVFSLKSAYHPLNSRLFPQNSSGIISKPRQNEKYEVNFARTSAYQDSAIPYCQRLLNSYFKK